MTNIVLTLGLLREIFEASTCLPIPTMTFDHDILLDPEFWEEPKTEAPPNRSTETLEQYQQHDASIETVSQLGSLLQDANAKIDLADMEGRACQFDIARLTRQVRDLEDELAVYDRRLARYENEVDDLQRQNDNLQERNSGLWLINAGLRHDLTEMIIGTGEDLEHVEEVSKMAEQEEWDELSGETLIDDRRDASPSALETIMEDDIEIQHDNDLDALTEDTSDIVDEAETAMENRRIGMRFPWAEA